MAHSSPEGIELGKGSQLVSMELFINKEKVLSIESQKISYTEKEVLNMLIKFVDERTFLRKEVAKIWFEQFKKK